jgi:hypothetical protein
MCCCGCALAILMEESRLASSAGTAVQHDEAGEAVNTVPRMHSGIWQAIARWFIGEPRPRNPETNAGMERSAVA